MILSKEAEVLIVGAGPSGLMMAAQLLRNGIHPIIIDSKTGPSEHSKAIAIYSRTLEVLRHLGLDAAFLSAGTISDRIILQQQPDQIVEIDLIQPGERETKYPSVLVIEQGQSERILIDFLTANACSIYWCTDFRECKEVEDGVEVKLESEGVEAVLNVKWLIGADGIQSKVRESLGIRISESRESNPFYLADLTFDEAPPTSVHLFSSPTGFTAYLPLTASTSRFIGNIPDGLKRKPDLAYNDVKDSLLEILGSSDDSVKCKRFTRYEVNRSLSDRFQSLRCFLIGDSAHCYSPITGLGINTGMQDAYNLGWKLAGVIKKDFQPKILGTYSEERIAAARLLQNTVYSLKGNFHRGYFRQKLLQNRLLQKIRGWIWNKGTDLRKAYMILTQIGMNYRNMGLSVHHSGTKGIQAGDRLPFIEIYNEKLKEFSDLHSWFAKPGFSLLVIGKLNNKNLLALGKWIQLNYPFSLNFYYLPPSDKNKQVLDCFEVAEGQKKILIVRPDLHIGYINDTIHVELIEAYFKDIMRNKVSA